MPSTQPSHVTRSVDVRRDEIHGGQVQEEGSDADAGPSSANP